MMLGRIILVTDGEHHSIIPKKWLTKIFVCGDVVSFLMQGAGKFSSPFANSNMTGTSLTKTFRWWHYG